MVRNEDFVYNPRISTFAPVGPINRNKLDRNGVMSPLYTVFRTHGINNTFLEQYFRSIYWHSFMKLNGDSGARSDRFSIKDSVLIEMPIPYPGLKEQLKIGEYLTELDNLITLHQREPRIKVFRIQPLELRTYSAEINKTSEDVQSFRGFTGFIGFRLNCLLLFLLGFLPLYSSTPNSHLRYLHKQMLQHQKVMKKECPP